MLKTSSKYEVGWYPSKFTERSPSDWIISLTYCKQYNEMTSRKIALKNTLNILLQKKSNIILERQRVFLAFKKYII